jgi:hypothetical protein
MAQATDGPRTPGILSTNVYDPIYQAYEVLRWGFTIAPILAGLDKFLHLLANWDQYLAPAIARMLPFSGMHSC